MPIADGYENEKGKRLPAKKKATPFLDEFGEDLTKAASEGKLDTIIGRDREIYRICQILARRKKNNPSRRDASARADVLTRRARRRGRVRRGGARADQFARVLVSVGRRARGRASPSARP